MSTSVTGPAVLAQMRSVGGSQADILPRAHERCKSAMSKTQPHSGQMPWSPSPRRSCTQCVHAHPPQARTACLIRRSPLATMKMATPCGAKMTSGMPTPHPKFGAGIADRIGGIKNNTAPPSQTTGPRRNHNCSRPRAGGMVAREWSGLPLIWKRYSHQITPFSLGTARHIARAPDRCNSSSNVLR